VAQRCLRYAGIDLRTARISFHNDFSISCFGIELSGSSMVAGVNLLSITSGSIGRIPVLLKLESTFPLVNEDCQAAQLGMVKVLVSKNDLRSH
jgi:hypothetical protein